MTEDIKELETALGLAQQVITVQGEPVTIAEFSLDQLPELLRLMDQLRQAGKIKEEYFVEGVNVPLEKSDFIHGLLQSGAVLVALLDLATNGATKQLGKIGLKDALPLATAVFEVNQAFFVQLSEALTSGGDLLAALFRAKSTAEESGPDSSESSPGAVIH